MLRIKGLDAYYGLFQALFGVDFQVAPGETVALIGANGAGKTTLLRAIAGALHTPSESMLLNGLPAGASTEKQQLERGIALVPEGRRLFASLSVRENLLLGERNGRVGEWTTRRILGELPALEPLLERPATALSGGQQQLVAIARALVCNPSYLLCDEVSLGLSPLAVGEVYRLLEKVRLAGTAIVLVEQNVQRALVESDRYFCIQKGRIVLEGNSANADFHAVAEAYFGV
ncbi:branched chain amino acid ABC transporter ATPase [Caballeronia fortuita]|uniref:Branched chain amino acid ABC transporter ATPase n=1 Tax=Caballeronia fortuita TaxID=1777138 RepID=A0A158CDJ7_9BURK|nr:ABC transporter ATP-binding protein [Caballeronia fortuita]SAK79587.1 branched chain amino acid ABC transporter ATPase [Caballeronia fortuita]